MFPFKAHFGTCFSKYQNISRVIDSFSGGKCFENSDIQSMHIKEVIVSIVIELHQFKIDVSIHNKMVTTIVLYLWHGQNHR